MVSFSVLAPNFVRIWYNTHSKMADDVDADIADALNTISSTTERSSNMKKELKNNLRNRKYLAQTICKTENIEDSKSRKISELETLVATTKAELEGALSRTEMRQGMTPINLRPNQTIPVEWRVAPSGVGKAKLYATGQEQARL